MMNDGKRKDGVEINNTTEDYVNYFKKQEEELEKNVAIVGKNITRECAAKTNYSVRHNMPGDSYNPDDIKQISSYNALRLIYRNRYNVRSTGTQDPFTGMWSGREIHPLTNQEMECNYINDFSMAPKFDMYHHNKFWYSQCVVAPTSVFPFVGKNGYYANLDKMRLNTFISTEKRIKKAKPYTRDFFSINTQVNPLLYPYAIQDENGNRIIMDADGFLEKGFFHLFAEENYLMCGNQYAIPLWHKIINTANIKKDVYDEDGEYVEDAYEECFENQEYLLKDNYTNSFYHILQNPKKYFKFLKQNNFDLSDADLIEQEIKRVNIEDVKTREETRGHLFFDTLNDVVFQRMINYVKSDKDAPSDTIDKINTLRDLINNPKFTNRLEFDGFPMDQYFALNNYTQYRTEDQKAMDNTKDLLGDYIMNVYRAQYNAVFSRVFKVLPYIMSPVYKYRLQSPAMNIMYTAFSIMAVKDARNNKSSDYIEDFFPKFVEATNKINCDTDPWTSYDLYDHFSEVFSRSFLVKHAGPHIKRVLPILMRNATAVNFDQNLIRENMLDPNDIDAYFTDKMYTYVETEDINKDNEKKYFDKSIILLTEFFHKMEKIRYFDAATFSIDYTVTRDKETCKSLKLFADALQEACYIHMNTLGGESFFNGEAPSMNATTLSKSIFRDEHYLDLQGMDDTRLLKTNVSLFKDIETSSNAATFHKHNSYHSYMAMINLYTSLVYSITITLDNCFVNPYSLGPYANRHIRRPHSLWAIMKRYAFHLTYFNNNGYGIYNDKLYSPCQPSAQNVIQKIQVSQRVKWLTYGLHMKVWYSDGYFFYTNYKKMGLMYQNNIDSLFQDMYKLYEDHVDGLSMKFDLFNKVDGGLHMCIIPPNIGLSLAPTAGSHSILTNVVCLNNYLNGIGEDKYTLKHLIHHGFKDIMVGDTMSSILGDRQHCIQPLLNKTLFKNIAFNNVDEGLQRVYSSGNCVLSMLLEAAIATNISYLYNKVIRPYYLDNETEALLLNGMSSTISYDHSFFKNMDRGADEERLPYNYSWCSRALKDILYSNRDKTIMRSVVGRLVNLYRIAVDNYKLFSTGNSAGYLHTIYSTCFGFSLMNAPFIKTFKKGLRKYVNGHIKYGLFDIIFSNLTYGSTFNNKARIATIAGQTMARVGAEDMLIGRTFGGCLLATMEDPMLHIAYNNIDFSCEVFKPSINTLYTFGKDILYRVYTTVKRMIVDLNYNGDPIGRITDEYNMDDTQARYYFANEALQEAYMVMNRVRHIDQDIAVAANIKKAGNLYDFGCTIGQFFDYDFIAGNLCLLLNDSNPKFDENDGIKHINNVISMRDQEYLRYCHYIDQMDTYHSQVNSTIDYMIKKRRGTLKLADSVKKTVTISDNDKEVLNSIADRINTRNHNMVKFGTNFSTDLEDTTNVLVDMEENNRLSKYMMINSIGASEKELNEISKEHIADIEKEKQEAENAKKSEEDQYIETISKLEGELHAVKEKLKIANGTAARDEFLKDTIPPADLRWTIEGVQNLHDIDYKGATVVLLTKLDGIIKALDNMSIAINANNIKLDRVVDRITNIETSTSVLVHLVSNGNITLPTSSTIVEEKVAADIAAKEKAKEIPTPDTVNSDAINDMAVETGNDVNSRTDALVKAAEVLMSGDNTVASTNEEQCIVDNNTSEVKSETLQTFADDGIYDDEFFNTMEAMNRERAFEPLPPEDIEEVYTCYNNGPTNDNDSVNITTNNYEVDYKANMATYVTPTRIKEQSSEYTIDLMNKGTNVLAKEYDSIEKRIADNCDIDNNMPILNYEDHINDVSHTIEIVTALSVGKETYRRTYPCNENVVPFDGSPTNREYDMYNLTRKKYEEELQKDAYYGHRINDPVKYNVEYDERLFTPTFSITKLIDSGSTPSEKVINLINGASTRPYINTPEIFKAFDFSHKNDDFIDVFTCDDDDYVYSYDDMHFVNDIEMHPLSMPDKVKDGPHVYHTAVNMLKQNFTKWAYDLRYDDVDKVKSIWYNMSYQLRQEILLGKHNDNNPFSDYHYYGLNEIMFMPLEREAFQYYRIHPEIYLRLDYTERAHLQIEYIKQYIRDNLELIYMASMYMNVLVDVRNLDDVNLYRIKHFLQHEYIKRNDIDLSCYKEIVDNLIRDHNLKDFDKKSQYNNQTVYNSGAPISIMDGLNGIVNGTITNHASNNVTSCNQRREITYKEAVEMSNEYNKDKHLVYDGEPTEEMKKAVELAKTFRMIGSNDPVNLSQIFDGQYIASLNDVTLRPILNVDLNCTMQELMIKIDEEITEKRLNEKIKEFIVNVEWDLVYREDARKFLIDAIRGAIYVYKSTFGRYFNSSMHPMFDILVKIAEAKKRGLI